jgi:hypothetical protein
VVEKEGEKNVGKVRRLGEDKSDSSGRKRGK